jgi:uncharacterized protein (TIGR02391 family)
MAKRRDALEPKPPTISLQEGKRRLTIMRDKAKGMLSVRPLSESAVQTWDNTALDYIKQTFGEDSAHIYTFIGQPRIRISDGYSDEDYDVYAEREDAERLDAKVKVLDSLVEQIDTELSFAAPAVSLQQEDFWSRLHPSVTQVVKARFDASHYADAVEAAFKELNSKVKAYMKRATGQEFDGADLMQRAFSPNAPVVRLADLSTEDGKSIQQGYMQIFAGSMTGIRNPKAHSNITIDAPRAIHFLHLASLLHAVFDERL